MTTVEDQCSNEQHSQIDELERLNTLFAKRYTSEDDEYQKMAKPHSQDPPIIPDWDQKRNRYPNEQRHRFDQRYHPYSNGRSGGRHNQRTSDYHSRNEHYHRDRSPTSHYHQDRRR